MLIGEELSWQQVATALGVRCAQGFGQVSPAAGVIDSQSLKKTESGVGGYDAGKKIKGHKRHIITDTSNFPVGGVIHTADVQDRDPVTPDPIIARQALRARLMAG